MARQGKMARHQGIKAKMARQRWQGTQGIGNCHHRHAIIGKACHRQGKGRKDARHRHAIIGIIIGNCHRHRQVKASASQGIGMPSASASAAEGRQDAAQWRSIVMPNFQECLDAQLCKFLSAFTTCTKEVLRSALRKVRQTECVAGMHILPSGRSEAEVTRVAHGAADRRVGSPAARALAQLEQNPAPR